MARVPVKRRLWILLAWLLSLLAAAPRVAGHAFAPSRLDLVQLPDGRLEVRWKTPLLVLPGADIEPELPLFCETVVPPTVVLDESVSTASWTVDCAADLAGQRIGIRGLENGKTDVLVRIELIDGRTLREILTPRRSSTIVPEREAPGRVFGSYWMLGVEHILLGPDHLLFVFGLLLLVAGRVRALVMTITAFTVGHSITLSLAALGLASVSPAAVEVAIAASILVLAVELARSEEVPAKETLMRRFPWGMALVFGLLHGFGFAAALTEVGLPQTEIPLALLAFNVGIEVGQLCFVLVILAAGRLLRPRLVRLPVRSFLVPVYVLGSLAAYWCIERAVVLF